MLASSRLHLGLKERPAEDHYYRICLGEGDTPELADGAATPARPDRWVHACSCTLVSHESCLLEWIESSEENPTNASRAPKCPQCGTRYLVRVTRSPLLRYFNKGYNLLTSLYRVTAITTVVGTTVLTAATYGGVVIRVFLGEQAFYLYFGDSIYEWALHFSDFVAVPISLMLSESFLFDTFIPLSIPLLLIPAQFAARTNLGLQFPPSPRATLIAWPAVRFAYNYFWKRVVKTISGRNASGYMGSFWRDLELLRVQRDDMIEEAARLEEDVAEQDRQAAEGPAEGGANPVVGPQNRPAAAVLNNPNAAGRVLTITFGIVAHNVLSSLMTPFIGAGVGRLLHAWSQSSLVGSHAVWKLLGGGRMTIAPGRPAASLWGAGSRLGSGSILPVGLGLGFVELDPIWWRNAVGMAAYVAASDLVTFLHLWLVVREHRQRRIVDRSFRGIDPTSLDLVEA